MTMDDPTTSLYRPPTDVCIVVAGSEGLARDILKQYAVNIQLVHPPELGVVLVMNSADATLAMGTYAPTTPWCVIADGLTDTNVQRMVSSVFGARTTISRALGVVNKGVAWRRDQIDRMGT